MADYQKQSISVGDQGNKINSLFGKINESTFSQDQTLLNDQVKQILQEKNFQELRYLGKGGFGIVYLTKDPETSEMVAIKAMLPQHHSQMIDCFNEASNLSLLSFPNVVKLLHFFADKKTNIFFIVQQYAGGGSLESLLIRKQEITSELMHKIVVGLLRGIQYIHSKNIIHGDIKPANILLTKQYSPLFADFGLSKQVEKGTFITNSLGGSSFFASPEQLNDTICKESDYFQIGLLIFYICGFNDFTTIQKLRAENYPKIEGHKFENFLKIAKKFIKMEIKERITPEQALLEIPGSQNLSEIKEISNELDQITISNKNDQIMEINDEVGNYKGNVVNNKKQGYGVLIYQNGDKYEGEFFNNLRHGKGKFKNAQTGQVYEGQFFNNQRSGQGKIQLQDGSFFNGEYLNDKANGYGEQGFIDGSSYKGMLINSKYYGKGIKIYQNGNKYDGDWIEGNMQGLGKYMYANGDVYEGGWFQNNRQGVGKQWYANGDVYEGSFLNDQRNGRGLLKFKDGRIYDGEFQYDVMYGKGRMVYQNQEIYEGEFQYNVVHGKGRLKLQNNDILESIWVNNVNRGEGKLIASDGTIYVGFFIDKIIEGKGMGQFSDGKKAIFHRKNGKYEGLFKLFNAQGKLIAETLYKDGVKVKQNNQKSLIFN